MIQKQKLTIIKIIKNKFCNGHMTLDYLSQEKSNTGSIICAVSKQRKRQFSLYFNYFCYVLLVHGFSNSVKVT